MNKKGKENLILLKSLTIEPVPQNNIYLLKVEIYNNSEEELINKPIKIEFYDEDNKIIYRTEFIIKKCLPGEVCRLQNFFEKKGLIGCRYKISQ